MKYLVVVFVMSVLAFVSCGRYDYPAQLVKVDSLCDVCPDSAVAMLKAMEGQCAGFSSDAKWYYRLLGLKAHCKAYSGFSEKDTAEANAVLAHYVDGGDRRLLPLAYYYAGCAVRDVGKAPMAIDYFRQAMETMPDTTDLELRSILNFRTGFLLLDQGIYDPAIAYFKESLRLEGLRKDTAMMAYCHEKLAFAYCNKGVTDSALYYYGKANQCAVDLEDSMLEREMTAAMASYYISLEDYGKADSCLTPYFHCLDSVTRMSSYSMASKICYESRDYDSVIYLCNELLKEGNLYQKQSASRILFKTYSDINENAEASKYLDMFVGFTDTIDRITATEVVARMNASYNYNQFKLENAELKTERSYYIMVCMALFSLAVSFVIWGVFSYRRSKERMSNLEEARRNMQQQSDSYIRANNARIEKLQRQLDAALQENESLAVQLTTQKNLLELQTEMALSRQQMAESKRRRIVDSEIYKRIVEIIDVGGVLVDADWAAIEALVIAIVPNFKTTLYGIYSLSRQESVCVC